MKLRFLGLLLSLSVMTQADELRPFTTDGCSVFPDGTPRQTTLWLDCCVRHDLAYWKGGSYQDRLAADEQLEACVANIGEPAIAALMLSGVRVGGSPFFPTTYRWGYGWSYTRGYKTLTADEQLQVHERLNEFRQILNSLEGPLSQETQ